MYVRLTHNPQVKCEGTDKCTLWLGWLPQYKMAKNRIKKKKKKNRTENPTKCVRPELQTSLHVLQQKCFRKNKNPTSEHNNSASLPASCGLLWNYAPTVTKETAKHICRHFKLRTIFWVPCNEAQAGMNKLCLQAEAPCHAASTGHLIANLFLR